jgi:hypothetical protein
MNTSDELVRGVNENDWSLGCLGEYSYLGGALNQLVTRPRFRADADERPRAMGISTPAPRRRSA